MIDVYIAKGDTESAYQVYEKAKQVLTSEELDELATHMNEVQGINALENYSSETELYKETIYFEDGGYCVTELSPSGTPLNTYTYNANGVLEFWSELELNENYQSISQHAYNSDGSIMFVQIMQYDENGIYIGGDFYDGEGNLTSYDRLKFDAEGNVIGRTQYDSNGNVIGEYDN